MRLSALELRDFRNAAEAILSPHPRFNVLVGENGQGKTNLLEAIYWLATLRPLRARRLRELVRWGQQATSVEAKVEHEGLVHRLGVKVVDGARRATREGKPATTTNYFGALAVVVFTPDDVGLVRGAPADRRRFLDRAVFTGRPSHLADVLTYRRALSARNRLIRDQAPDALFDAYEGPLAAAGARLVMARRTYVHSLMPRFQRAFAQIVGDDVPATLAYRAGSGEADTHEAITAHLVAGWAEERVRDRQRGFTQRGPHVDDLTLRLFDRPARLYASQGQQRAMVLALKIAEIETLAACHGVTPVLLLDDVSSELDPVRTQRLFDFLGDFDGQVFITTTHPEFLQLDAPRHIWRVVAGTVAPEPLVG